MSVETAIPGKKYPPLTADLGAPDMMWHLPIPRLDYDTEAIIAQKIDEAASSFDEGLKFEEKAWEILECEIQKLGRENG